MEKIINSNESWISKIENVLPTIKKEDMNFIDIFWLDYIALEIAEYKKLVDIKLTSLEHQLRIDTYAIEGDKVLFFGYSQGSLYSNLSYKYAKTKIPEDRLKIVYVAPSIDKNDRYGDYVLVDQDTVINLLRYSTQQLGVEILEPSHIYKGVIKDSVKHYLQLTYLNSSYPMAETLKIYMKKAIKALEDSTSTQPENSGFFSVTLTWNGNGDVDLHVFEPNGKHVYYGDQEGTSGYLDYDNTEALGPEHYYASCDPAKLQLGTYKIAIANFRDAEYRIASVQIHTAKAGVLGTETVTLGPRTRDVPAYHLFNVVVSKNASGVYSARLVNTANNPLQIQTISNLSLLSLDELKPKPKQPTH